MYKSKPFRCILSIFNRVQSDRNVGVGIAALYVWQILINMNVINEIFILNRSNNICRVLCAFRVYMSVIIKKEFYANEVGAGSTALPMAF